ncbi:MAG: hypothetical protein ACK559_11340, partial [bacterium]
MHAAELRAALAELAVAGPLEQQVRGLGRVALAGDLGHAQPVAAGRVAVLAAPGEVLRGGLLAGPQGLVLAVDEAAERGAGPGGPGVAGLGPRGEGPLPRVAGAGEAVAVAVAARRAVEGAGLVPELQLGGGLELPGGPDAALLRAGDAGPGQALGAGRREEGEGLSI